MASVGHLSDHNHLDLRVLHGDGTTTVAKKGGDGMGYSGDTHQKGETVIASIDNHGYVLAPLPVAPANEADTVLLPEGLKGLKRVAKLTGLGLEGADLMHPLRFSKDSQGLAREGYVREATGQIAGAES